jgi:hypothetical protein
LNSQKWQVVVSINYSPGSLTTLPAASPNESSPEGLDEKALPELGSILRQQQTGIWSQDPAATAGATAVFELNEELVYGQEVVLRTGTASELYLELLPTSP